MKPKDWDALKQNLRLLCSICKRRLGGHGAKDGYCPTDKGTHFKPYKDMREKPYSEKDE